MLLSLIVAVAENGVIGREGGLPWHLSADLKNFKKITMGHSIIMGRKTFESIGRPLPGRQSIVITRDSELTFDGCEVCTSLAEAVAIAQRHSDQAFIIGGCQIYELALPRVDRLYWTQVFAHVDGDVSFPEIDWDGWKLTAEEHGTADERNDHDYSLREYQRLESSGAEGREFRSARDGKIQG